MITRRMMESYSDDLSVVFWVPGLAVPKGSVRAVPIRRADGSTRLRLVQERGVSEFVATVRTCASRAFGLRPPWTGPVRLEVNFMFPRPKCHYRGGKPGPGRLRPSSPVSVTRRPDLDKVLRAVLDAISGVVIADDAQVAEIRATKEYVREDRGPGVWVSIRRRPK